MLGEKDQYLEQQLLKAWEMTRREMLLDVMFKNLDRLKYSRVYMIF